METITQIDPKALDTKIGKNMLGTLYLNSEVAGKKS